MSVDEKLGHDTAALELALIALAIGGIRPGRFPPLGEDAGNALVDVEAGGEKPPVWLSAYLKRFGVKWASRKESGPLADAIAARLWQLAEVTKTQRVRQLATAIRRWPQTGKPDFGRKLQEMAEELAALTRPDEPKS